MSYFIQLEVKFVSRRFMQPLLATPINYQSSLVIPSPVTGVSLPLSEIPNYTLRQGAWGDGMAILPKQQRIQAIKGWTHLRSSPDRKHWVLAKKFLSHTIYMHLKIWSEQETLPIALKGNTEETLFILNAQAFATHIAPPMLSLTLTGGRGLYYQTHYGKLSQLLTPVLTLFKEPILSSEKDSFI